MAISVQMPALGESVTEGTVTRWLKQEGDTVELDEPLLEVSTDKVDTEIPSPAAGVLTKIVAQEDDTVEIGGELAVIGEAGEQAAPAPEPEAKPEPEPEPQATEPSAAPAETAAPEPAAPAQPAAAASAPAAASGSATTVVMPELGESVTEGTVTRWLKKVGDSVGVDEPLVEVSTDKVDTEIPSPVAGTLLEITAEEDDTVAVGGELAKIGDASAAPAAAPAPTPAPAAPAPAAPAPEPKPEPKPDPRNLPAPAPAAAPAPQPRPPPRRRPPTATARRTSPRWCESWPRRTASTSPR